MDGGEYAPIQVRIWKIGKVPTLSLRSLKTSGPIRDMASGHLRYIPIRVNTISFPPSPIRPIPLSLEMKSFPWFSVAVRYLFQTPPLDLLKSLIWRSRQHPQNGCLSTEHSGRRMENPGWSSAMSGYRLMKELLRGFF